MISFGYLRSLFITQNVNEQGYYQYFIKRSGEYFVEECDDLVPIDKVTKRPMFDLNPKYPWQLLLLKIWLKEKSTMGEVNQADPFEFLDAFGLPSYSGYNFKKEHNYLKNDSSGAPEKKEK